MTLKFNGLQETTHQHPLYPITTCLEEGYLRVSSVHVLYYATYGNRTGTPVIVLHGGPGAGCQEAFLRVFDPDCYFIIMFDQRGSMRSSPLGCIEENTPQYSIEDIETLRNHFGIKQWVIFGGSWGAALAILYGQKYPEICLGFVLRGIFLGRQSDYLHIIYGMGRIFPEAYESFVQFIPEKDRSNLLTAYYQRVMDPNLNVCMPAARKFMEFDLTCGSHIPDATKVEQFLQKGDFVLGVSRLFLHYSIHNFFLENNQILANMHRISHLPAIIVHGRWDIVCLPEAAYLLYKHWGNSALWFVSSGGHSSNDPAITTSLAAAMDTFSIRLMKKPR